MPNIKYAVIIHGKDGSPTTSWLPWLKQHLEARGILCKTPTFPPEASSTLGDWLPIFDGLSIDLNQAIFVAHARGAMALLRWVNQLPKDTHMPKIITISCNFDYQPDRDSQGFYDQPLDFDDLMRKCSTFVIIHSADDPYVPIEAGEQLARHLNAKFVRYENAGHFSSDKLEAPEILREVEP